MASPFFTGSTNQYQNDPLAAIFNQNPMYAKLQNNAYNYANAVYDYGNLVMAREDSAYQRMVEDMKKAGLNPWTGISSGGAAASNINPASNALDSLCNILLTLKQSDLVDARMINLSADSVNKVVNGALSAAGKLAAMI